MNSYPRIRHIGHPDVKGILDGPVLVQEKIDGSQLSFGMMPDAEYPNGQRLRIRSKQAEIYPEAPPALFKPSVDHIISVQDRLVPGWVYRGEAVGKPKHNSLAYDRTPAGYIVLFDIQIGEHEWAASVLVGGAARDIEVEPVRSFGWQTIESPTEFLRLLENTSQLGGQPIEGVVIKRYDKFGPDAKPMMAKFVSEHFKEVHSKEWKADNPSRGDVYALLTERYRTPARWQKSVQHLREAGKLTDSPQDIGLLIQAVREDVIEEHGQEIRDELFAAWSRKSARGLTAGLPEWYKEQLMRKEFDEDGGD